MSYKITNQVKQQVYVAYKRLEIEIKRIGKKYTFKQDLFDDDGMNGKIPSGQIKKKIRGILQNTNGTGMSVTESGRTYNQTHTFVCLFDKCVMYADTFYSKNGKQYRVLKVENVGELDLYLMVSCRETDAHLERYDNNAR